MFEIEDILKHYDIGYLVDQEQDQRGYNNTSYSIETEKYGSRFKYFLRRYKIGINQSEIEFEHSIIKHLKSKGFNLIAGIIETRQGHSYLPRVENDLRVFYTIFEFLEGEDKYTWVDPKCSSAELNHAASILAQFHSAVADLKPKGRRIEPKILELLPQIEERIRNSPHLSKEKPFDFYLKENIPLILRSYENIQRSFVSEELSEWLELVIHSDYHPGNMKFEGMEIVGLCDFDWSKIDYRCFDVALAIWYFVTDWKEAWDGRMRLRDFDQFIDSYQSTLRQSHSIKPLSELELRNLPIMICAGNLYVLNWTVADYYDNDVQQDEYMVYLRHCINFCKWYEQEGERLLSESIQSWLSIVES